MVKALGDVCRGLQVFGKGCGGLRSLVTLI